MIEAHYFFLTKGLLAFVSILLLVLHMNMTVKYVLSRAQTLRYISLLGFAVAVFYASAEQMITEAVVESRHWGALIATVILLVASVASISEDRTRR